MKNPVIAIGLDAADPSLIETWMSQGHLKNLRRLRDKGAYTRLKTFEYYRAETPWTTFLTGCSPKQTGYWAPLKIKQGTYEVEDIQSHDFKEHEPFYALKDQYRVAAFDIPQAPLAKQVNGLQVLAWGAHSPQTPSHSLPASLYQEIVDKHGEHPTLRKDHASIMDVEALQELQKALEVGIARRATICKDLLQQEPWDLFLTIFGETHSAGHYMWHLSQTDHPLYPYLGKHCSGDPLLEVFEKIDTAVGDIIDSAPENANVVVFAAHGMGANVMDLPSMFFLPEFLYRWNFPEKYGIARGKMGKPPGEPLINGRAKKGWMGTMWSLKYEKNPLKGFLRRHLPTKLFNLLPFSKSSEQPDLISPFDLLEKSDPFFFQSAVWYKPFWPQMKAFALPSYSEGYIRINLQGREPNGIVAPDDYDAVCDELIEKLYQLKDARTGEPMVKEAIRTRQSATESDPKLPDADIVLIWQEKYATDVVESSDIGRIGPVPFNRTGSHRSDGFLMMQGPDIAPGASLSAGHSLDLAPTILSLMGAEIPDYCEGKPLLERPTVLC
ncbi:MAG: alkaline phosphatase family protein [Kastovskya adunca ATA6-11-RM4]|jgi:predicted AlkP superfamily phosphohydrolase/phosphomutase|nr:alkaline phosphatase family protein [Kastovskya adunca ATA6-11-RM4]